MTISNRPRKGNSARKHGGRKRAAFLALILLVIGLGVIFFPHVQKAIYQWRAKKANAAFSERMNGYAGEEKNTLY